MVIKTRQQVFDELETKFFKIIEDETKFMQNDLEKIIESFNLAEKSLENETKESLEKEKILAYEKLDILKIKTLNDKIDNIVASDYVGTDS